MLQTGSYNVQVARVIDGDSFTAVAHLRIDHQHLGLVFTLSVPVTVRILGIDAPETRGATRPQGLATKTRLRELIEGREVELTTQGLDKYGRTLARVWVAETDVAATLLRESLAVPYSGGSRSPHPVDLALVSPLVRAVPSVTLAQSVSEANEPVATPPPPGR